MKKIITVLFFAGFLTTASFAQSGHRQQTNNQSNGNAYKSHQSSGNNVDQYSQNSRDANGGYLANGQNNRNTGNEYSYKRDGDNHYRGDMKRDQYDYPSDNQRRWEDHSYRSGDRDSRHHRMYRDDRRD